jgi:hypothetical protein
MLSTPSTHMMCSPGTESEAWNAFSTRFFQVA